MTEAAPKSGGTNENLIGWDSEEHWHAELEAKYIHDAAEFRRGVIGYLKNNIDSDKDWLWANYKLPAKPAPGEPALYNTNREILVICKKNGPDHFPLIRILTKELFDPSETCSFLTEDFVLDHENDAQYFIDTAIIENGAVLNPTLSSFFMIGPDGPQLFNCQPFPPMPGICISADDPRAILPFGHYKNIGDRIDSLDFGNGLLSEIKFEDPADCGAR